MQLVKDPTREGALLDLLPVNREGLVRNVTVGGCLGLSDNEIIVFDSQRRRGVSRTATLAFCKIDFGLLRSLIGSVPLGGCPEGQRSQARLGTLQE